MAITTDQLNVGGKSKVNSDVWATDAELQPLTKTEAVMAVTDVHSKGFYRITPKLKDAIIGLLTVFCEEQDIPQSSLRLAEENINLNDAIGLLITNLQDIVVKSGNPAIVSVLTGANPTLKLYDNSTGFFIGRNIAYTQKDWSNQSALVLDVGNAAATNPARYDAAPPQLYLPSPSAFGYSEGEYAGLVLHGVLKLGDDCKIVDSDGNTIVYQGKRM